MSLGYSGVLSDKASLEESCVSSCGTISLQAACPCRTLCLSSQGSGESLRTIPFSGDLSVQSQALSNPPIEPTSCFPSPAYQHHASRIWAPFASPRHAARKRPHSAPGDPAGSCTGCSGGGPPPRIPWTRLDFPLRKLILFNPWFLFLSFSVPILGNAGGEESPLFHAHSRVPC